MTEFLLQAPSSACECSLSLTVIPLVKKASWTNDKKLIIQKKKKKKKGGNFFIPSPHISTGIYTIEKATHYGVSYHYVYTQSHVCQQQYHHNT
jgi:hypothetical protein